MVVGTMRAPVTSAAPRSRERRSASARVHAPPDDDDSGPPAGAVVPPRAIAMFSNSWADARRVRRRERRPDGFVSGLHAGGCEVAEAWS